MQDLTDIGSLVNSKLIQNSWIKIKTGDSIQFGKDDTEYIFENIQEEQTSIKYSGLIDGKISLINKENLSSIKQINHLSGNLDYEKRNNNEFEKHYDEKLNENEKLDQELDYIKKENNFLKSKISNLIKEKTDDNYLKNELTKAQMKNNALMIHASFLQKNIDIMDLEKQKLIHEYTRFKDSDLAKLISEKEKIIDILTNEIRYHQDENQKLKNNYKVGIKTNNESKEIENDLSKRVDRLLDSYICENKKLHRIIDEIKNRENYCNKKWNELINENNDLNEKGLILINQLNEQRNFLNKIIEDYDLKVKDIFITFPKLLNELKSDNKKVDAATYLIEQMNVFMIERRNYLREKLENEDQINQLKYENDNLKHKLKQIMEYTNVKNANNNSFQNLKNRIDELEDLVLEYKNSIIPNQISNMQDIISNLSQNIQLKDVTIHNLTCQIKDYLRNENKVIFNEKSLLYSLSHALKQKDSILLTILNQQEKQISNEEKIKLINSVDRNLSHDLEYSILYLFRYKLQRTNIR